MKKNVKLLVALITVAVLLGGVLFAIQFIPSEEKEDNLENEITLVNSDYKTVTEISVKDLRHEFTLEVTPVSDEDSSSEESSNETENLEFDFKVKEEPYNKLSINNDVVQTTMKHLSELKASKEVVKEGDEEYNLEIYGLSEPAATFVLKFSDSSSRTIKFGDESPSSVGRYVMVDDNKTVYFVSNTITDELVYSLERMCNSTIAPISDKSGENPNSIKISGSAFEKDIDLVKNNIKGFNELYMLADGTEIVNSETCDNIANYLINVSADSVEYIEPTDEILKSLDLNDPYIRIDAEYGDMSYSVCASEPDVEGNAYIMQCDLNAGDIRIVYKASKSTIPWLSLTADSITPKTVYAPSIEKVKHVSLDVKGKNYYFDLVNETSKDEDGNETTETVLYLGDKKYSYSIFTDFYNKYVSVERQNETITPKSDTPVLSMKLIYDDKSSDVLSFYESDSRKVGYAVNGKQKSYVYESFLEELYTAFDEVLSNEMTKESDTE